MNLELERLKVLLELKKLHLQMLQIRNATKSAASIILSEEELKKL